MDTTFAWTKKQEKDEFFKLIDTKISSEVGEQIMSLATRLREEGRAKSKIEMAIRMHEAGSALDFIVKVTGLSLKQIKDMQKALA